MAWQRRCRLALGFGIQGVQGLGALDGLGEFRVWRVEFWFRVRGFGLWNYVRLLIQRLGIMETQVDKKRTLHANLGCVGVTLGFLLDKKTCFCLRNNGQDTTIAEGSFEFL